MFGLVKRAAEACSNEYDVHLVFLRKVSSECKNTMGYFFLSTVNLFGA